MIWCSVTSWIYPFWKYSLLSLFVLASRQLEGWTVTSRLIVITRRGWTSIRSGRNGRYVRIGPRRRTVAVVLRATVSDLAMADSTSIAVSPVTRKTITPTSRFLHGNCRTGAEENGAILITWSPTEPFKPIKGRYRLRLCRRYRQLFTFLHERNMTSKRVANKSKPTTGRIIHRTIHLAFIEAIGACTESNDRQ